MTLEEGSPALVRWTPVTVGARRDDLVVVDVTSPGGTGVRCAFRDAGEGVVPGSLVRASSLGLGAEGKATVTVRRVRREAFAAPGIDAGEIRFDLAVSGRAILARTPRP